MDLTGKKIKNTYQQVLNTSSSYGFASGSTKITDGLGNESALELGSDRATISGSLYVSGSIHITSGDYISTVRHDSTLSGLGISDDILSTRYDSYIEPTYSGSLCTNIDIWDSNLKTTKLFTKNITYSGSLITAVTDLDEVYSKTLTTNIIYSGSNIINITKTIS
jgi:hypothetical protein